MSEFETLPKFLPPREASSYIQKVPKIIWQTMKTNKVPAVMKGFADSWINLNPEYEYRLHDNEDVVDFISKEFPQYLEGYNKIKYGASKADLWRYLIMYKYGGVYADMDCRCIRPLRLWVDCNADFVSQIGINKDLCQWLIITTPGNPIFLYAAEKTLQNLMQNSNTASYYGFQWIEDQLTVRENVPLTVFNHEVLGLSGPPVLQEAAETCLKNGLIDRIIQNTQIICVSGEKTSCQMNGNVTHETGDKGYRRALNKLKTPYYDGFLTKFVRKLF